MAVSPPELFQIDLTSAGEVSHRGRVTVSGGLVVLEIVLIHSSISGAFRGYLLGTVRLQAG